MRSLKRKRDSATCALDLLSTGLSHVPFSLADELRQARRLTMPNSRRIEIKMSVCEEPVLTCIGIALQASR